MRTRVVIVLPYFGTGGGECMVSRLAAHLDLNKVDAEVICVFGEPQNNELEKNILEHGVPIKYIRKGKVSGFPQATLSVSYPAMAKDFTIMEWSLTADNKDADDVIGSLTPWTLTIGTVVADNTVSAYSVRCDELYVRGKQITSSTTSDKRLKTNISSLDNKI